MSLPGAGLLAVLRGQAQGGVVAHAGGQPQEPAGARAATAPAAAPAAGEERRFAARSDAVRALEHAVAAGSVQDPHKRVVAQGRPVPPGPVYVYDIDVHEPHEAQVMLEVRQVSHLPCHLLQMRKHRP
jgi:hypothetical protein